MKLSPEWKNRSENFSTMVMVISDIDIEEAEYETASSVIWSLINYIEENRNILDDIEVVNRNSLL